MDIRINPVALQALELFFKAGGVKALPRFMAPPPKRGNAMRAALKKRAREITLAIIAEQREEERIWRNGGKKPKWLKPHASATVLVDGVRVHWRAV